MPSYDQYERRRRQTYTTSNTRGHSWGHWLPLAITFTVAAGGLAAWIWKERKDSEDDENYDPRPPPAGPPPTGYGPPPQSGPGYGPPPGSFQDGPPLPPPGQPPYSQPPENRDIGEESIVTRMSGALRRTPSPQQIFDGATKRVAAGVAAAGAAVGGALSSITEEDRRDYEDHRSWSEEAESQSGRITSKSSKKGPDLIDNEGTNVSQQTQVTVRDNSKRKAVAIVVSAVTDYDHDQDATYHQEHASILSHLPEHIDSDSRIFVLIYSPDLKQHPLASNGQEIQPPTSMTSSYSNIGHEDAQSPPKVSPVLEASRSKLFDTLYTQAKAIVDKDTMIMPFNTATGYIPMLRHLGPDTVYLQASLAGGKGEELDQIKSWVNQIILVVGDDSGHGGLVDSEDELGTEASKWWIDDARIGLGKGIEVVDGLRVGEDFRRRVKGHD